MTGVRIKFEGFRRKVRVRARNMLRARPIWGRAMKQIQFKFVASLIVSMAFLSCVRTQSDEPRADDNQGIRAENSSWRV